MIEYLFLKDAFLKLILGVSLKRLEVSNQAKLPTQFGEFYIQCFREKGSNGSKDHLVVFTPNFLKTP